MEAVNEFMGPDDVETPVAASDKGKKRKRKTDPKRIIVIKSLPGWMKLTLADIQNAFVILFPHEILFKDVRNDFESMTGGLCFNLCTPKKSKTGFDTFMLEMLKKYPRKISASVKERHKERLESAEKDGGLDREDYGPFDKMTCDIYSELLDHGIVAPHEISAIDPWCLNWNMLLVDEIHEYGEQWRERNSFPNFGLLHSNFRVGMSASFSKTLTSKSRHWMNLLTFAWRSTHEAKWDDEDWLPDMAGIAYDSWIQRTLANLVVYSPFRPDLPQLHVTHHSVELSEAELYLVRHVRQRNGWRPRSDAVEHRMVQCIHDMNVLNPLTKGGNMPTIREIYEFLVNKGILHDDGRLPGLVPNTEPVVLRSEVEAKLKDVGKLDEMCSMCLFTPVDSVVDNCKHMFCWDCVVRWNRVSRQCPFCRQSMNLGAGVRRIVGSETEVPEDEFSNARLGSKLMKLLEFLEETPRVILFCSSNYTRKLLARVLKARGVNCVVYHGSMGRRNNLQKRMNATDAEEGRIVYILSIESDVAGMNLVGCNTVALFECKGDYKTAYQALSRVWRTGQMRECRIHTFCASPSVENALYKDGWQVPLHNLARETDGTFTTVN